MALSCFICSFFFFGRADISKAGALIFFVDKKAKNKQTPLSLDSSFTYFFPRRFGCCVLSSCFGHHAVFESWLQTRAGSRKLCPHSKLRGSDKVLDLNSFKQTMVQASLIHKKLRCEAPRHAVSTPRYLTGEICI